MQYTVLYYVHLHMYMQYTVLYSVHLYIHTVHCTMVFPPGHHHEVITIPLSQCV